MTWRIGTPHGQPWKALWYLGLLVLYQVLAGAVGVALWGLGHFLYVVLGSS